MTDVDRNRLVRTTARLLASGSTGIAPYLTAGDGGFARTRSLLEAVERAGASCVELGVPFGDPIADGPVLQAAAARALAYQAAELAAAGKECLREVSMVKALSPEVLHEVVHGCLQLHGGSGFMRGTAIERMVRDARVLTIGGGATEVMLEEVAKRM